MKPNDIEITVDSYEWSPDDRCILTNEPAQLVPVMLRRMYLLGGLWAGESFLLLLPLAKRRSLVLAQYLRMLRPYIALTFAFIVVANIPGLKGTATHMKYLRLASITMAFLTPWLALGKLLAIMEPIRLIKVSRDKKRIRIRFTDIIAAKRAKETLQNNASIKYRL